MCKCPLVFYVFFFFNTLIRQLFHVELPTAVYITLNGSFFFFFCKPTHIYAHTHARTHQKLLLLFFSTITNNLHYYELIRNSVMNSTFLLVHNNIFSPPIGFLLRCIRSIRFALNLILKSTINLRLFSLLDWKTICNFNTTK